MAPLLPAARCSLARFEQHLQQLVDDSASLDESEARDEVQHPAGRGSGAAPEAQLYAAGAVTDAPGNRAPLLSSAAGQMGAPQFSQQLELARLRQERDEAVREGQAALRRERDTAASEAAHLRHQLQELQQAHAALAQQRTEHTRQAEQAAATAAADKAAQGAALERLQAAHAAAQADCQRKSLRIQTLETQQAVLLESYRALEAELRTSAPLLQPPEVYSPARAPHPSCLQLATAGDPPCSTDLVLSRGASLASKGDAAERLAASHSHLALAMRCAELQFAVGQAERRAQAAEAAAGAAEEQAAGLRLLLAKTAGSAGAAALQQRLDTICWQLEEARTLGALLQRQLAQKEEALAVLEADKQQLQADLRLMLQAKSALAAFAGGLQAAAG